MSADPPAIAAVDFASVATRDLPAAVRFYGEVLGLPCSVHAPERHYAEFETPNLTLSVYASEAMGLGFAPNPNALALRVGDVAAARAALEARGVAFHGDTIDTGVCHMAFFTDGDGNALMLHRRYAPRHADGAGATGAPDGGT